MNTRLLRKVAKHIAEEPRRFVMGSWIRRKSSEDEVTEMENVKGRDRHKYAPCGTAACISGWGHILTKTPTANFGYEEFRSSGASLFDLNDDQAQRLFFVSEWPERFHERFMGAATVRGRVSAAVARIEHFIKTKGKE